MFGLALSGQAYAQSWGSFFSPGPLAEAHAEYEGLTQCVLCHEAGRGLSAARCMDCHDEVEAQVASKDGFHADKGEACQTCHREHRGRDYPLITLEEKGFDHTPTGFPLENKHAEATCEDCHKGDGWGGLDDGCRSCHDEPHGTDLSTRPLLAGCESCHGSLDWKVSAKVLARAFDHADADQVDMVLKGAHLEVECEACHEAARFVPTAHEACTTCHEDPHRAPFSNDCTTCHSEEPGWHVAGFDHLNVGFVLSPAHRTVACAECHGEKVTAPLAHGACVDCHDDPHRAPFSDDCTTCHAGSNWRVPTFDHLDVGFLLEGSHREATCDACHGAHVTAPRPHEVCADCHKDPHVQQFIPRDCSSCHSVNAAAFALVDFDHSKTIFPLIGKHLESDCQDCHVDKRKGPYTGMNADDCDACHTDAHSGKFEPTNCRSCHEPTGWNVGDFDHSRTDYPLVGSHVGVACDQCHTDEKWHGVAHESCATCHADEDPHDGTFPADRCASCHDESGWDAVTFDHAGETAFALDPQHVEVSCAACHTPLDQFAVADAECTSCHEDDRPLGHFEGGCATCHVAARWSPAVLPRAEHARTGFALVGAHASVVCADCHAPDAPKGEAIGECVACHGADDVHRHQLGDACQDCHSPTTWLRTRFRHDQTGWPLRGAHRLTSCDSCHATGYIATPDECRTCHLVDAPMDEPAHQSPSFADCDLCHAPYTWDAAFPH